MRLGKRIIDNRDKCFKPVEVEDRPNNDAFMQFEEEIDDTVHCDELENDDYADLMADTEEKDQEHDVTEAEEGTEEIEERDVTDTMADTDKKDQEHYVTEHDVTQEIVVDTEEQQDRDVTQEVVDTEEQQDRDVTQEVVDTEEGDHDVTDEGNDSDESLVELYTIPYQSSSENSLDEELPAMYQPEKSPMLHDDDACINFNWAAVLKDMKTYTTFNSLKQYILRTWIPEVNPVIKYIIEDDDIIDTIAHFFYPTKDGPKGYMPVETGGDGNCGDRALAHVLLSDESWHHEARVWITFVAVLKAESFLSHQVLTRGVAVGSANRPASYGFVFGITYT